MGLNLAIQHQKQEQKPNKNNNLTREINGK